ncbi:MAG: TonB family protein, partial [Leptotrichiaceae bacterium]|nr:TonB family protein [Leptotrichiaceae bacterium]
EENKNDKKQKESEKKPEKEENTVIQEKKDQKNSEIKTYNNKPVNSETESSSSAQILNKGSGNENNATENKNNLSEGKEKGNEQNQSVKKSSGGNVCRENIDYTVVYNPDLQYPMAAERLGVKKSVIVNVKINFNGNGSVSVIGASGGEGIFQSEAKKAAGKIKVKIKNPETLKCTITKPFRFNPK